MEIGLFGATGKIGKALINEALQRGHAVRAFSRNPEQKSGNSKLTWQAADILDPRSVSGAVKGLDVVINAISSGKGVEDQIANADVLPRAAKSLVRALNDHTAVRLIVVGGGGSLEIEPGLQYVDSEGFAERLPILLGVTSEYIRVSLAHRDALNLYRLSNRNWTYVSPSAGPITETGRTGRVRVGGDRWLGPTDRMVTLSVEDLAAAVVDEIETPCFIQRRFAVGY